MSNQQPSQHELMNHIISLYKDLPANTVALGFIHVENSRVMDNMDIFEAILREAYPDVNIVVGGHHIMFTQTGNPMPAEISSADTLIFNHDIAKTIWGNKATERLTQLALEPPATREKLLRDLYLAR